MKGKFKILGKDEYIYFVGSLPYLRKVKVCKHPNSLVVSDSMLLETNSKVSIKEYGYDSEVERFDKTFGCQWETEVGLRGLS